MPFRSTLAQLGQSAPEANLMMVAVALLVLLLGAALMNYMDTQRRAKETQKKLDSFTKQSELTQGQLASCKRALETMANQMAQQQQILRSLCGDGTEPPDLIPEPPPAPAVVPEPPRIRVSAPLTAMPTPPPRPEDRVQVLVQQLNQYISEGIDKNFRLHVFQDVPDFQGMLMPVERTDAAGTMYDSLALQVYDNTQEKKFFALVQGETLFIFPNSGNLSDYTLKTREIFDGYDPLDGVRSVIRPALARRREGGHYAVAQRGILQ